MTKTALALPSWGSESSEGKRPVTRQGQPGAGMAGIGEPRGAPDPAREVREGFLEEVKLEKMMPKE